MAKDILTKKEREKLRFEVLDKCRIDTGERFRLSEHKTHWAGPKNAQKRGEGKLKSELQTFISRITNHY